jgi:membrane associated rhomboid family serine protease
MSEFRYTRPDSFPPVVKNLVIINVLVFLAQQFMGDQISLPGAEPLGLTGVLALWPIGSDFFRPYQVVTHMFAHGSIGHIFFNMLVLWMFGRVLENIWGGKRFLIFYLASGLGAAALHLGVQYFNHGFSFAVGASGAIMGVMAAFAFLFPNTELFIMFIPIPVKAKWAVLGYVAVDLFSGISSIRGDNIAHFAHLGGAITGFIIVLIWNRNRRRFY